jgi:hypothetical protein
MVLKEFVDLNGIILINFSPLKKVCLAKMINPVTTYVMNVSGKTHIYPFVLQPTYECTWHL